MTGDHQQRAAGTAGRRDGGGPGDGGPGDGGPGDGEPGDGGPGDGGPVTEAPTLDELYALVADLLAWTSWEARRGLRVLPAEKLRPLADVAARVGGGAPAAASAPARPRRQAGGARRGEPGPTGRRGPVGRPPPAPSPPSRTPPRRGAPPARRTADPSSPRSSPESPADRPALTGAWARLARPGALIDAQAPAASSQLKEQLDAAVAQGDPADRLAGIRAAMGDCRRCGLCASRSRIVFGVGDPRARLVILGEGPGEQEDRQGEPFVGPAGAMLDRMVANVLGLARSEVYILNMVKCRPPRNRNPQPDELDACRPFLMAQLAAVRPELVLLMGSVASRALLGPGIMRARGRWHELAWPGGRSRVMPTFHPAYLLRRPQDKRLTFEDLKQLRAALDGLPPRAG